VLPVPVSDPESLFPQIPIWASAVYAAIVSVTVNIRLLNRIVGTFAGISVVPSGIVFIFRLQVILKLI
jgi:hypothetical protein